MENTAEMPDVTKNEKTTFNRVIDWVGMSQVEVSLKLNEDRLTPAHADLYVDLNDPKSKGIHMSRLYLTGLEGLKSERLSTDIIKKILIDLIEGQKGQSLQAKLRLNFDLPLKRKALVSQTYGERHYPVTIEMTAIKAGGEYHFDTEVQFKVLYSSTCPCSAALARQLVKNNWAQFAESSNKENFSLEEVQNWLEKSESIVATPHAQRSQAYLKVLPTSFDLNMLEDWIEKLEIEILKTPVQTAVKREDEQEFARLNGTNLMFCEDAARKVADWLDHDKNIEGYSARMEHWESLHAHNAVSEISNNWRI